MPQITTSKTLSNMSQMLGNRLDEADESFSTFFLFVMTRNGGKGRHPLYGHPNEKSNPNPGEFTSRSGDVHRAGERSMA